MHKEQILQLAEAQRAYITAARRQIHEHPELSFQEKETSAFVAAELRACGLEPAEGFGGSYGIVVDIEGNRPGPTIALRADMDALPVEELPPGGAIGMIEAGCMDGVDAVFGLHQSSRDDAGVMLFGAGPRSA
jgi:metal-dependent amidase/aminoacylase/carboxypeptidase family protein